MNLSFKIFGSAELTPKIWLSINISIGLAQKNFAYEDHTKKKLG
jgi:hypothetical protein